MTGKRRLCGKFGRLPSTWRGKWGKDPYGEGWSFWTDRWIPPESVETELDGKRAPIRT